METFLLPLVTSFVVGILTVPLIRWISIKTGKVSLPRRDRWHSKPTPTLGGVGIFIGFSAAILIFYFTAPSFSLDWPLLLSAGLMFGLGLYDDYKPLNPVRKLLGQIISAIIVVFWGGLVIRFFPWPIVNILLTLAWIIGITNGINLLDNMDGIAGGIAMIAAAVLGIQFWLGGDLAPLWLASALVGSALSFLIFNFPPARIFMGDSGSMFLGFTLASLAIVRSQQASNVFAVMAVPVLIFLAPILDTAMVAITRILRGQSPIRGGTDHTTHRLVAFGLSPRQVASVLYVVAAIGGLASVAIEAMDYELSLILVPVLIIGLSLFTAYLGKVKVLSVRQSEHSPLAQFAFDLVFQRRLFELLLDLAIISISYYLGYWTRFGMDMTTESAGLFLRSWPAAVGIGLVTFSLAGVYRSVWGHLNAIHVLRYFVATAGSAIGTGFLLFLVDRSAPYPLGVWGLYGIFLFLALSASRGSFYLLDRFIQQLQRREETGQFERILILGAGMKAESIVRWLSHSGSYEIVGFIDDDRRIWGRTLYERPILGGPDQIRDLLDKYKIQGVVVGLQDFDKSPSWAQINDACREKGIWVRKARVALEDIP